MTQEILKQLVTYNQLTGKFTVKKETSQRTLGTELGYANSAGYVVFKLQGKMYKAHRLAFLYVRGYLPIEVDHINHDRADNRWLNLREVTRRVNAKNKALQVNNSTGVTGVSKVGARYKAHIQVNRNSIHLGYFMYLEDAVKARAEANTKYQFHLNHGEDI